MLMSRRSSPSCAASERAGAQRTSSKINDRNSMAIFSRMSVARPVQGSLVQSMCLFRPEPSGAGRAQEVAVLGGEAALRDPPHRRLHVVPQTDEFDSHGAILHLEDDVAGARVTVLGATDG